MIQLLKRVERIGKALMHALYRYFHGITRP